VVDVQRLASWDREFRVWHYTVSHSQLLLRSVNVEGFDTRVDLLFKGVNLMHIREEYRHLVIDEISDEEVREKLGLDIDLPSHGVMFVLNDGAGYIHAVRCLWHEDSGGHHVPSKFGPLRGTE
jgi:hypothetical protein